MLKLNRGSDDLDGFQSTKLTFARERRGLTKQRLAEAVGLSSRSITAFEAGEYVPDRDSMAMLSECLRFPVDFFLTAAPLEEIPTHSVSFRSISKMSVRLRASALCAGTLAVHLNQWLEEHFSLPVPDLPFYDGSFDPEAAAGMLRLQWGLGESPVKNVVHLLESKGVRVFSLALDTLDVDAFSFHRAGTPFVLLNTQKSAERSRFDAVHELGHLVLHRHGGPTGLDAENQANQFASAFLMPAKSLLASGVSFPGLQSIVAAKKRWGVSVAALNYRLHQLRLTSDWTYRTLCVEIGRHGYQSSEPNGIERETSQIFEKVMSALKRVGKSRADIARALMVDVTEIDSLTYGLTRLSRVSSPFGSADRTTVAGPVFSAQGLKLVK